MVSVVQGVKDAGAYIKSWMPFSFTVSAAPVFSAAWVVVRTLTLPLPHTYNVADACLFDLYQGLVASLSGRFNGVEIYFHGDRMPAEKENVIYISNHQSAADWMIVDQIAMRRNCMGRLRYIMKEGLKLFPLYGFYFKQHGCIFVRKSFQHDEKRIMESLRKFKSQNMPLWLVIFPEGTRYNGRKTKALEASQAFSRERGMPVLNHVLVPRTKGFEVCLEGLRDYIDAIYDVTLVYGSSKARRTKVPGLLEFLNGRYDRLDVHIRRIPRSEFPPAERSGAWLHELFAKKDELVTYFHTHNESDPTPPYHFFEGDAPWTEPVSFKKAGLYVLFWVALLAPVYGTAAGRSAYLKMWLYGGAATSACMFIHSKLKW